MEEYRRLCKCYYGDDMEEYRRLCIWRSDIKVYIKEIGVDVIDGIRTRWR